MAQESANPSTETVRLHRVLAAKPDKVFRAFTTPDAMARWLPVCTKNLDSDVVVMQSTEESM